ncbi:MAG: hypothetical protein RLZZ26_474, partial [Candidatus Parcubacteria bacterium]
MSHDGAKKNVKGGVWVTYVVEMVRINRIRRFVMQPRTYFDPDEITARAGSMKAVGQQAAIVVERVCGDPTHDFEIIDGESRWLSAREAGIEEVLCIIRSVPYASPVEKHLASLVANCNRSQHTPMDFSNALQLQVREGMSQAELARATGEQPMRISLYLSLQDLHPDIQPLLEPTTPKKGRLSPAVGFSLARVPRDKQLEALALTRRPDGRVVKSKVDAVVATMLGHKKSRIRIGRAKRRASIEHAL